jgi:hypothetical protein
VEANDAADAAEAAPEGAPADRRDRRCDDREKHESVPELSHRNTSAVEVAHEACRAETNVNQM